MEDDTLVMHAKTLATWENRPRVAGLGDCGQHERNKISTALELIPDRQTTRDPEVLKPLLVELSFQVESALLVSDVTGGDEEGKTDPQQERAPGKETAVAEENVSPTDEVTMPNGAAIVEMTSSSVFPTLPTSAQSHTRNHMSRQKMRETRE